MPQKSGPGQRQMCGTNRKGNQVRIQRMAGVVAKELGILRKQAGIQDLQNPRKGDLRVFRIKMIALDQKSDGGQQCQAEDTFYTQGVLIPFSIGAQELQRTIRWA